MADLKYYLTQELDPTTGRPTGNQISLPMAPEPEAPKRNLLSAGLSAGVDELQGTGGALAAQVGKLLGIDSLSKWGQDVYSRNQAEAQQSGRPDLETAPWREGGAPVLPWLGYQAAKQVPMLAGYMGAGLAAPEVAALTALGSRIPQVMGGARGLVGEAAATAAKEWGRSAAATTAVGSAIGSGSMYGQAIERGDPTTGDALKAAAMAPVYGAMDAFGIEGLAARGFKGGGAVTNPVKRVLGAAAVGAASEVPQEAAQTAMELSFRPDIPVQQKMDAIVDAGLTGGALGGLFGGVGGLRRAPRLSDPNAVPNEGLAGLVDQQLGLTPPETSNAPATGPLNADPLAILSAKVTSGQANPEEMQKFARLAGEMRQQGQEAPDVAGPNQPMPFVANNPIDAEGQYGLDLGGQTQRAPAPIPTQDSLQARFESGRATPEELQRYARQVGEQRRGQPVQEDLPLERPFKEEKTEDLLAAAKAPQPEIAEAAKAELAARETEKADPFAGIKKVPKSFRDVANDPEKLRQVAEEAFNSTSVSPKKFEAAKQILANLGVNTDAPAEPLAAPAPEEMIAAVPRTETAAPVVAQEIPAAPTASAITFDPALAAGNKNWEGVIASLNAMTEEQKAFFTEGKDPATVFQAATADGVTPTQFAQEMANMLGLRSAQDFRRMGNPNAASVEPVIAPVKPPAKQSYVAPEGLAPDLQAIVDAPRPEVTKTAGAPKLSQSSTGVNLIQLSKTLPAEQKAQFDERMNSGRIDAARQMLFENEATRKVLDDAGIAPRPSPRDEQAAQQGDGFTRQAAERIMRPWLANAKNIPQIVFYDTRDAPQNDKEAFAADLWQQRVDMGFFKDTPGEPPWIAVAVNRHASVEQLKATIYHELLGHFGVRRAFGKAYRDLLVDVHARTPWLQETIAQDPNNAVFKDAPGWVQTEEWLARQLEPGAIRASLMDRLTSFVKSFARKWGYKGEYSRREVLAILGRASAAGMEDKGRKGDFKRDFPLLPDSPYARPIPQINKDLPKVLDKAKDLYRNPAIKENGHKLELYITTLNHHVQRFGRYFKNGGLRQIKEAHELRATLEAKMAQVSLKPVEAWEKLDQTQKKVIRDLMTLTQFNIDPRKKWAENAHALTDDTSYNAALEREWKKGYDAYNTLKRNKREHLYDDFVAVNEGTLFAQQVSSLYQLVQKGKEVPQALKDAVRDPTQAYLRAKNLHEKPQLTRDFWKARSDEIIEQVSKYVGKGNKASALSARLKDILIERAAMDQAPNFHMPRFGQHVVSFNVRTIDSKVDTKATEAIAKAFADAGITGITIARDTRQSNVFIRSEKASEQDQIHALATELMGKGLIQKDSLQKFMRNESGDNLNIKREWLDNMITQIEAGFVSKEELDAMPEDIREATKTIQENTLKAVRGYYMDMLPDTAYSKVMMHRNAVSGFSDDFVRGFAFRSAVGARALAGMYGSQKLQEARISMIKEYKDAWSKRPDDVRIMHNIIAEHEKRESQRPAVEKQNWIDMVRAINHAYFLGMSPSYVLVNMTQLGTLLWPELAKHKDVGFTKAARAIAAATKPAMAIITATIQAGAAIGGRRAADAIITEEVLEKALPGEKNAKMREYLMSVVNSGKIDIGGASREQGRVVEDRVNSKADTALRWSAAFGYYSETFTRLVAAIAAEKVGRGEDVNRIIDESMLQYANWNTARATGKMGLAGPVTPIMTAFMQYQFQVLEKLYREFHTAMSKEEGASEARRFLGAHLGAMTVIAGTLGLPFATVIASVIDKMKDVLDGDDEPYDVKAAWRNFLADIFGKDVGEILSRGAPRGLGIDISQRAGEQDLLPFSKILADRREWNDATRDWARDLLGSPFSMGLSILKGFEKISKGDVVGGMAEAVPNAIKGPIKAYKYGSDGYTDGKGNKLPLEPGANDVLAQALGFQPANLAEYREAKQTLDTRKGLVTREAQNIRKNIVTAYEEGDKETAKEWIAEARKFDKANPQAAVLPSIGATLQRRAMERAQAEATRTPLGTKLKDFKAPSLTSFANY